MSRAFALVFAFFLTAAAEGTPSPHASGVPAGPGPGCGGGFTAARGDTLYSIARRCETSVTELAQENRLGQPPVLAMGQQLAIPGFARAEAPKPPEAGPPPPPPPLPPRRDGQVYHFQPGDTLYSLARWARTSLAALRAANLDVDPQGIEVGDPIRLPAGAVWPEAMRARERGGARMTVVPAPLPLPPTVTRPSRPPGVRPPPPPRPPLPRAAPPPPDDDDADKPKPDDEDEDDGPTPGGMDDGGPEPDGM